MKKYAYITAVAAVAFSVLTLFGCQTIVTDVNAEMAAIYPDEDLGIPVKLNENYIEVAYNPSAVAKEETEIKEADEKKEEAVSEIDNDNADVLTSVEEDTETPDADEETEEESDDENGGKADADNTDANEESDENTEESDENSGSEEDSGTDLNASMAADNFDAEFYAKAYPDVVAVFGDSPDALYKHYQDYGKAEGRSCNEEEFALLNETAN